MTPFDVFVDVHRHDLRRIAAATRGEYALPDVIHEAWLMGQQLGAAAGARFDAPEFQSRLLAHLYQHLVRYREQHVRHAMRLDHARGGDPDAAPALLARLAGDEGRDALARLVEDEDMAAHRTSPVPGSLGDAWLHLLRRCDGRMLALARSLLISRAHAYRCCARVRALARWQHAIALPVPCLADRLRPWRTQRAERIPRQLAFAFDPSLPLRVQPRAAGDPIARQK